METGPVGEVTASISVPAPRPRARRVDGLGHAGGGVGIDDADAHGSDPLLGGQRDGGQPRRGSRRCAGSARNAHAERHSLGRGGPAGIDSERAPRCEGTARRKVGEIRRAAGDGRAGAAPWWRAVGAARQEADRVGMARRADHVAHAADLRRCARHTSRQCGPPPRPPRDVVRDEDHREAELALQLAQQQQDLDLDGRIERGGRLVGEQDAAGLRRARARSWRAGACRQTSRADRRRAGARGWGCARARTARAPARAPRRRACSCRRIASMICSPTV